MFFGFVYSSSIDFHCSQILPTACPCLVPWHAGAANAQDFVYMLRIKSAMSLPWWDIGFAPKFGNFFFFSKVCSNASTGRSRVELVLLITKGLARADDTIELLFFECSGESGC